ncbi:hypothetical protein F5Y11DRAFT_364097 [Daldinia sp. FL1419]|nr:hypothetical protein F5Y11DRAFT_364097 [Daldinia sp. FL1419]
MASTITSSALSSSTSSSSVSFQDPEDLASELQPAPLRLPRRRTDPNLDGTSYADEGRTSGKTGGDSSSTAVQESVISPPIVKSLSQRRAPAPKLESLVSRFETLDAVSNSEPDSSSSKPTVMPQAQKRLRHSRASESLQSIASGKHGAMAGSLDDLPGRAKSPDPRLIADRRRVFEHKSEHSHLTKAANPASNQTLAPKTVSNPATASPQHFISFGPSWKSSPTKSKPQNIPDIPLRHLQKTEIGICEQKGSSIEQPVRGTNETTASSKGPVKKMHISVADLRKSFEKNLQAADPESQVPDTYGLSSEMPQGRVARISKEAIHSLGASNRRSISSTRATNQRDNTAIQSPQNRMLFHTKSENKLSEQTLPVPYTFSTLDHTTTVSKAERRLSRRIDNHNIDGAMSLEGSFAQDAEGELNSTIATVPNNRAAEENKSSRTSIIHSILANNSKVSFHNVLPGKHPTTNDKSTSGSGKASKPVSNPVSTPTPMSRCTGRDGMRPVTPRAHADIDAFGSQSIIRESPVKDRIQKFESLENGPLNNNLTPCYYDVGSNIPINKQKTNTRQIKPEVSGQLFRQPKAGLWRRISNTITQSIEGTSSNSNDRERSSSSSSRDSNTYNVRSSSIRRQSRYRRSNLFGYRIYRTSEVIRSSTDSAYTRSNININEELIERFENQHPYKAYRRSPSGYLSIRKTFPFLARMSDDLGCSDGFDDFGLDGSALSRAIHQRDKSSVIQPSQTTSSPISCSDSNAISSTTSKQTTAERKRRRLEEKELRKEKETKLSDNQEPDNAQNKGQSKDGEGKKKESSWSKKTASGFMVRQINDVKLRHPKPRRPGQIKKIVNMYKDKSTSGIRLGKGSGISSGSGTAGTAGAAGASSN